MQSFKLSIQPVNTLLIKPAAASCSLLPSADCVPLLEMQQTADDDGNSLDPMSMLQDQDLTNEAMRNPQIVPPPADEMLVAPAETAPGRRSSRQQAGRRRQQAGR